MKRNIISLLIGLIIGAILVYFAMNRKAIPSVTEVLEGKYKVIKQAEFDSLTALVNAIEVKRHIDSLKLSNRLNANTVVIQRYKDGIEKITFKDYTDPELDSLIEWLYPQPGQ